MHEYVKRPLLQIIKKAQPTDNKSADCTFDNEQYNNKYKTKIRSFTRTDFLVGASDGT